MESIIQEILTLRGGKKILIDRTNRNRYRLVCIETDGSKTGYYFSVPIYNHKSEVLLDMAFRHCNNGIHLTGSNSDVLVEGANIILSNSEGEYRITFPSAYVCCDERRIGYIGGEVYPTTNGIACKMAFNNRREFSMLVKSKGVFDGVRHNGKYLALMKERYCPYITVSVIGSLNSEDKVISAAEICYQHQRGKEFQVTFRTQNSDARCVLFEVNLQESKLFQDTTVESRHSNANNAFGGTAYLGYSCDFGRQWLYVRPDMAKFNDLRNARICNAMLHIPQLNQDSGSLLAYQLSSRFCSFGSTWKNKIPSTEFFSKSTLQNKYLILDVSSAMVKNECLQTQTEGWVIKRAEEKSGFSVVSTGDSFWAPQILAINFK